MSKNEDNVTITKEEYDNLFERDQLLCALECAGVE